MGKMIICENCGKEYDEDLVRCPSCDSVNLHGAEKAYMNKLEGVRKDMEDLDEAPKEEIRQVLSAQKRRIKRVFRVLAVLGAVLILAAAASCFYDAAQERAQNRWMQEHFPQMDALYNAGDFDGLMDYYDGVMADANSGVYYWKHYDFLNSYRDCLWMHQLLEEMDETAAENDITELFYLEWTLKGIIMQKASFTTAEYEAMEPYLEESEEDFAARWNMPKEDYDRFYKALEKNRGAYISYTDCIDYAEEWLKENG